MKRDPKRSNDLHQLCDVVEPDDGADPRIFFKQDSSSRRPGRKTLQLCATVARVLNLVLAEDVRDESLHGLSVRSVAPAPDVTHLLVTVVLPETVGDVEATASRLAAIRGWLRSEVCSAIRRKRAPDLSFQVVPPEEVGR